MRALILAGGAGRRLKPITDKIPKPLVSVKDESILNHIVRFLSKHGVREFGIIIAQNHRQHFKDWIGKFGKTLAPEISCKIFVEEKPMGTFGYLRNLKTWLDGNKFFLANGDSLLDFDLAELVRFHETEKPIATIGLIRVADASTFGSVILDHGRIKKFEEKSPEPQSDLISTGLYLLEPDIFEYDDPSRDFLMIEKDIFPKIAERGQLSGFEIRTGRFFDCGTLERLERARNEW